MGTMLAYFRTGWLWCVAGCCGWFITGAHADSPDPYQTAEQVDRSLATEIFQGDVARQVAPPCDDETFVRRVFLDLVGKPPSQEDVLAFCLDDRADKRRRVVDRLLADEDFGANWGKYWRDVIMFRRSEDRALLAAGSLADFFADHLNTNAPWSDVTTALVTASGEVRENGATGLIVAQAGMPEDVTGEISRIFLGIQISCAQCHDHPTDQWKREQFHHLAAFFPRVGVRLNPQERTLTVTTIDRALRFRPNNNNRFFGTLEHYMPDNDNPASQGTLMQPAFFLTEQKLSTGTLDADRRGTLAQWLTDRDNEWFAKAFVNRIWAELLGQGFCEPVDDLGPDRDCTAPQTFDLLAQSFADSGYDVKWFYRAVMATEAYQRASRSRSEGAEPFTATCAQRLRGDQLFDAVVSVLKMADRMPAPSADVGPQYFRRDPRLQFNAVFGYDPSEPREDVTSSIPQALAMMNSPQFNQAISARRPDALGGILARNRDDRDALVELYLDTLGRGPTDREIQTCRSYIRRVGNRAEAFEDVLWSLLNSTEFLYRK